MRQAANSVNGALIEKRVDLRRMTKDIGKQIIDHKSPPQTITLHAGALREIES